MLGFLGTGNRTAVPKAQVEQWIGEGLIDYLGATDDVRPALGEADCVVLPSYREGLPRSLLEAAAMARPAIASDVPGCREVIEHGRTGLLCAVRSPESLAEAMLAMIAMPAEARDRMGALAREKAEREFDQKLVASAYLDALGRATE
jgi:glycosyltransferase involved in cell wall biosynthesis